MPEVELKFALPPEAHAAFRRLAALQGSRPSTRQLHALYFDTPDFELRRNELALRLRRSGRRWVQTLKGGHSGAGGLHEREEWESERPGPSLDLSLLEHTPLPALAGSEGLAQRLGEIFQVNVKRTTWELEPSPGNRVEVALDRGEVSSGAGREPVSEVEIESVAGDPLAVFEVAERLIGSVPLSPSAVTKAQRGYRLALGEAPGPVKARAAKLDATMTVVGATRASIAAALEQLQANEGGSLEGADSEYLHQMRVAHRRLRSALRVFRPALEPQFAQAAREELRWIARATGPARDWDVLATQTLPALLAAFGAAPATRAVRLRVAACRREARATMAAALASPRYGRLILLLARWLAAPAPDEAGAESLTAFASRIVRKRHRSLVAGARNLSVLTPEERHRLRLEAKRLRYAVEGFAPLFRRKRVDAYVEALSDIQEDLGRANDAAVAARLLATVELPATFANFARGWFAAQTQASGAGLERHGERLAATRRFWEKP